MKSGVFRTWQGVVGAILLAIALWVTAILATLVLVEHLLWP